MNKQDRSILFQKFSGFCAFCGSELKKGWHVSPILAPQTFVKEDGTLGKINDELTNKLPSCKQCDLTRIHHSHGEHPISIEEFRIALADDFEFLQFNPYYNKAIRFGLIKETNAPIIFFFERFEKTIIEIK